ncbi:MAG: DUF1302 domain-containing protein [Pseudomonadota bacterium]
MYDSIKRLTRGGLMVSLFVLTSQPLAADTDVSIAQTLAMGRAEHDAGQARTTLATKTRERLSRQTRLNLDLRIESALGDTGLGTRDTFAPLSRPWELGANTRLEIDEATIAWRKRSTHLTLGKQSVAWGVLDGLQVTDRLNPVRLREGVFTETRPERISRWGLRLRTRKAGFDWDAVIQPDTTVSQLPLQGDTFEPRAARLRGGLPFEAGNVSVTFDKPATTTAGLRMSHRNGDQDWSLLVIRGPEYEPIFSLDASGVTARYPTRTLLGATWQKTLGNQVIRAEVAAVPNQPVNLGTELGVAVERSRWIGGVGMDWDLPDGWFLNIQLAIDQIDGRDLARPRRDEVLTTRIRRAFDNDQWLLQAELIGNLGDGDGTFRPSLSWQVNDALRVSWGADIIWGEPNGLFGQFDANDRVWLRAIMSL